MSHERPYLLFNPAASAEMSACRGLGVDAGRPGAAPLRGGLNQRRHMSHGRGRALAGKGKRSAIILILPSCAGITPQGAGRRHHPALQSPLREFGTQYVLNSWRALSLSSLL